MNLTRARSKFATGQGRQSLPVRYRCSVGAIQAMTFSGCSHTRESAWALKG
jgi:hypothetical protein